MKRNAQYAIIPRKGELNMPEDAAKRNKRQYNWQKETYDRLNMLFEKGFKERIQAAADKRGLSTSKYVQMAVEKQLEQDKL